MINEYEEIYNGDNTVHYKGPYKRGEKHGQFSIKYGDHDDASPEKLCLKHDHLAGPLSHLTKKGGKTHEYFANNLFDKKNLKLGIKKISNSCPCAYTHFMKECAEKSCHDNHLYEEERIDNI